MILFEKFGSHGRLGNQLFQYAAMLGLSIKHKTKLSLPKWAYEEYFESKFPSAHNEFKEGKLTFLCGTPQIVNEAFFHYTPGLYDNLDYKSTNYNFHGYFQSEKYWAPYQESIRAALRFKKEFVDQLRRKFYLAFKKRTIAISIRRGDYVDNPNYELLPITYYITSLFEHFPDWRSYNIIVFSDDIPYCKVHFDCVDNVFFAENNTAIEDICLMSQCDHFILSNSSFSFWGAYLGEKRKTKIIRPAHYFRGELAKTCDTKDFWPERWIEHNHTDKRLDLMDVTFTVPVMYDHPDRKKNLDLCVCMLQHCFNTNVIIGEINGNTFEYMRQFNCRYVNFPGRQPFHRTKMLNVLAEFSETKFVANWDADVFVAPFQLYIAVERLRDGADMVYPYEWAFARIPRVPWFSKLEKRVDIGIVGDTKFNGMNNNDATSYGGAVLFNRESFFDGGGENENFISFGPEDYERYHRFTNLGYRVERVPGPLYHVNHYVGPNSSNRHPFVNSNRAEHQKILDMSKSELKSYVKTWAWKRNKEQKKR